MACDGGDMLDFVCNWLPRVCVDSLTVIFILAIKFVYRRTHHLFSKIDYVHSGTVHTRLNTFLACHREEKKKSCVVPRDICPLS